MRTDTRPLARARVTLLLVALLGASCQASPSSVVGAGARARGVKVEALAGGLLAALPSGSVFVLVHSFVQGAQSAFPSASHAAGFVYQEAGEQRFTAQGAAPIDLEAGQALFQSSVAHVHANPAAVPNHWYFFGAWPSSVRGTPPVNPLAMEVFATEDLPPDAVRPGPYGEVLRLVTLEPSGRTAAQRHGGTEVLFVLQGSVSVRLAGQPGVEIPAGQGSWQRPGAEIQVSNPSNSGAQYLDFYLTASGQPFEIDR
jgi:hypothetical protein